MPIGNLEVLVDGQWVELAGELPDFSKLNPRGPDLSDGGSVGFSFTPEDPVAFARFCQDIYWEVSLFARPPWRSRARRP